MLDEFDQVIIAFCINDVEEIEAVDAVGHAELVGKAVLRYHISKELSR